MAKPLQDWLDDAVPVVDAARRLGRIEQALRRAVGPALAPSVGAGGLRGAEPGAELTILAANTAVAARLRQMLPSLLAGLQSAGWGVGTIRVKVQPAGMAPDNMPRAGGGQDLGKQGIASFARLDQALPDSPLREAVRALLSRRRGE